VAAVCSSFHLAKDCGFKVVTHMMPDLPNTGEPSDTIPVARYPFEFFMITINNSNFEYNNEKIKIKHKKNDQVARETSRACESSSRTHSSALMALKSIPPSSSVARVCTSCGRLGGIKIILLMSLSM
jgi:hypothetical protein